MVFQILITLVIKIFIFLYHMMSGNLTIKRCIRILDIKVHRK